MANPKWMEIPEGWAPISADAPTRLKRSYTLAQPDAAARQGAEFFNTSGAGVYRGDVTTPQLLVRNIIPRIARAPNPQTNGSVKEMAVTDNANGTSSAIDRVIAGSR